MPTYRITDPDSGRVYRVTGDSPPTEAEIEEIVASQQTDPDMREQFMREEMQKLAAEQGPFEAAAISAGRGLTSIGRGLGLVEPPTEAEQSAIEALRQQRPIATTVGEVAGVTAPFLVPGMQAAAIPGTAARVGAVAGLGATEGIIAARGEGEDLEKQLTAGGLGGVIAGTAELVLPRIASAGAKIIRRILGRPPRGAVVDAAGRPSAELQEALDKIGMSFDDLAEQERLALAGQVVSPEEAARAAALRTQGLEPTRAQVTRSAADFQAQQEAAKTSGIVRDALEKQEAALTSRFDNAVLETGGEAFTPNTPVIDAVVGKATKLDQEISNLYGMARDRALGKPVVDLSNFSKSLKAMKGQDKATGGAISAMLSDLKAKGIIDNAGNVVRNVLPGEAEDIRKIANQLYDPQQPFRNIKLREIKSLLDDDVFSSVGDDIFSQARKAKSDFERELARAKVSKFDTRKTNIVRDVLENKINPDNFADKVVFGKSYRPEDLKQLVDYIGTDEAGEMAVNDLRANVLQKIKESSFIGPEDANGFKALSRDKLQKALSSIGKKKMDVLFSGEEQKFLNDMLQIAKIREPVRGTALGMGPSAQAINRLKAKVREGSMIADLVDVITFDSKGRAILRGSPTRIIEGPSMASRQAQSAAALTAAAAAQQEQQ